MITRALFVGGGTGGHSIPLLAVMEEFQKLSPATECHYVGSAKDMELPSIKGSSLRFQRHVIATGKLNRYLTIRHIPEGAGLVAGLGQAYFLLRRLRPELIFSKGGAASVPVAWAAARLGIPLYSHETDVAAGLANRFAARHARTVFTAFPISCYPDIPAERAAYVGQPVRPTFREPDSSPLVIEGKEIEGDLPLVTVTGGSQGGRGLNDLVASAWELLLPKARIVQVCGPANLDSLLVARERLPEELRQRLTIVSYLGEEFPLLIKRSILLVVRSGGTFFELAAARKAVVLVPLPTAAQNHQVRNAEVLIKSDAAVLADQDTTSPEAFAALIGGLLADEARRRQLGENLAAFDRPTAAYDMAAILANHHHS